MGRVNLRIVLFLCLVATVIAAQNECGWQANGTRCDNSLCCSCWGECGTDNYHCNRSLGCQSDCGPSDTNVTAYYSEWYPAQHNWDLYKLNVACEREVGNKSFEWRSKYNWTGFGGKVGPHVPEACGMCLLVTNEATGKNVTVRIVDSSGSDLDLDIAPFEQIDDDKGTGIEIGHLMVDYKFVDCDDDASSFISMVV